SLVALGLNLDQIRNRDGVTVAAEITNVLHIHVRKPSWVLAAQTRRANHNAAMNDVPGGTWVEQARDELRARTERQTIMKARIHLWQDRAETRKNPHAPHGRAPFSCFGVHRQKNPPHRISRPAASDGCTLVHRRTTQYSTYCWLVKAVRRDFAET